MKVEGLETEREIDMPHATSDGLLEIAVEARPMDSAPYRTTSNDGCDEVVSHFQTIFGDVQFRWNTPDGTGSRKILFDISHESHPPRRERRRREDEARRAAPKATAK